MPLATFAYVVSALEFLAAVSFLAAPVKTAEWFVTLKEEDVVLRAFGALFFVLSFLTLTRGLAVGFDVEGLVRLTVWIGGVKSPAGVSRRFPRKPSRTQNAPLIS